MIRWCYNTLLLLLLPAMLIRLACRSHHHDDAKTRWRERLARGLTPTPSNPARTHCFWIHAVSVGEVNAAEPLIHALQDRHPHARFVVTTGTATGAARVQTLFQTGVDHYYAPYDLPWIIKRWCRTIQPSMLLIMETELWPNMIRACHLAGIPIVLANARLSDASARGYQRIAWLARPMMQQIDKVAAQYPADAKRFEALGVPTARITITGNLKANRQIPTQLIEQGITWRSHYGIHRPVWVAGSTQEGEEATIIAAHQTVLQSLPNALLILAPRHPERFDTVRRLLQQADLRHMDLHPTPGEDKPPPHTIQVLLVNQMGQLLPAYACADIAFVGGSLVPHGGQNILEPAAMGKAILTGPHMQHFASLHQWMCDETACHVVHTADELAHQVCHLATNAAERHTMGQQAHHVLTEQQQALSKLMACLEDSVMPSSPSH